VSHQRDVYVVFITELSVCLWYSFMPTVVDGKVFPMCTVDMTEFALVYSLSIELRQYLVRQTYSFLESLYKFCSYKM
jgi:hypothetical protein